LVKQLTFRLLHNLKIELSLPLPAESVVQLFYS
jgi:hypothetical protein